MKPHPIHGYSNAKDTQVKTQGQIEREKIEDFDRKEKVKDPVNPLKKSGFFGSIKNIFK